jgi:hypothetical protein
MPNEHFGENRAQSDVSNNQQERLLWRNNEVRKATKDLRLNIEALPENFPGRSRTLELVSEILTLIPPLDAEDEARDEQQRRELSENLNRARNKR